MPALRVSVEASVLAAESKLEVEDGIVLKMYSFEHSRCSIPYTGASFVLMVPDRHLEVMF